MKILVENEGLKIYWDEEIGIGRLQVGLVSENIGGTRDLVNLRRRVLASQLTSRMSDKRELRYPLGVGGAEIFFSPDRYGKLRVLVRDAMQKLGLNIEEKEEKEELHELLYPAFLRTGKDDDDNEDLEEE